jgi:hypothetical protein
MSCENPAMRATAWRKSSFSTATSECVEVGFGSDMVAARDSKNPLGPVLVFAPARWSAFLGTLTAS